MTGYGLAIFAQHAALLEASAIDPEVARERGYVSVDTGTRLESAKFAKGQRRSTPGLLIPIYGTDGELRLHQYRPDTPRIGKDGRARKYETPWRQSICLDVPPRVRGQLADPDVPLWITEGARKADAAVSAGLCCISLIGVDGWGSKGIALPDWAEVRLRDRTVFVAFDSDVMTKESVAGALHRLTGYLRYRGATVRLVVLASDGEKIGLDDYLAAGGTVADLIIGSIAEITDPGTAGHGSATSATSAAVAEPLPFWDGDLDGLLKATHEFLGRFVAYPSDHAHIAHTLWCAHTHQMDAWESTPRIAFLSPEPSSGKTRALEVSELLVPRPVDAVNVTPAYLFRKVSDPAGLPTVLFDEIDTLFGPKAKDNEEIRGMLNAGHRRGASAGRCVTKGDLIVTEELPAYCALAMAGLGSIPDTLLARAVVVRMKRRGPGQKVEPFRHRVHKDAGHDLRDRLASWAAAESVGGLWPDMPDGIEDRDADVWEALLMVADAAGGDWPKLAREAAVALVADAKAATASLGIRLLNDLREAWDGTPGMHTAAILKKLNEMDEAPWGDLKGKPLDPRRLSRFLGGYEVHPADIRALDDLGVEQVRKGYKREDLHDVWARYLPPKPACTVCHEPIEPAFVEAGLLDHPSCAADE